MKSRKEKNWELIQQLLSAEVSGQMPRHVASTRTLFGIKSSVEEVIDRVVAEEEARLRADRDAQRESADENGGSAEGAAPQDTGSTAKGTQG